jgi:GTPase
VHLVDMTSDDALSDISMINNELKLFDEKLARKEQIIVLNKCDLLSAKELAVLKEKVAKKHKDTQLCVISAAGRVGLEELNQLIKSRLAKLKAKGEPLNTEIAADSKAYDRQEEGFSVTRQKGKFLVAGSRIERLLSVTDCKSPESIHHFNQVIRSMGVIEELIRQQIKPGNEIKIADFTFTFGENLF